MRFRLLGYQASTPSCYGSERVSQGLSPELYPDSRVGGFLSLLPDFSYINIMEGVCYICL